MNGGRTKARTKRKAALSESVKAGREETDKPGGWKIKKR